MKQESKAIGIGAGGHAKVVLDILLEQGQCSIVGLLDADPERWGTKVLGVPILGGDEKLNELIVSSGITSFFLGIGAVKSLSLRRKLYEFARGKGLIPLDVVHGSAHVSSHVSFRAGVTIMVSATINAASSLGENVIINSGAIVEHDCEIGNHVHIATGAHLAGGVVVADESMVGVGAVIRQGVRIGARSMVGAGAVVVKDVPDDCVVVGNPARCLVRNLL